MRGPPEQDKNLDELQPDHSCSGRSLHADAGNIEGVAHEKAQSPCETKQAKEPHHLGDVDAKVRLCAVNTQANRLHKHGNSCRQIHPEGALRDVPQRCSPPIQLHRPAELVHNRIAHPKVDQYVTHIQPSYDKVCNCSGMAPNAVFEHEYHRIRDPEGRVRYVYQHHKVLPRRIVDGEGGENPDDWDPCLVTLPGTDKLSSRTRGGYVVSVFFVLQWRL
mmetsp:Transcript_4432/g.7696  ORF Transcript_4432/g.7696 Transcript_4432/m.7696 type:complete len:219 (-) Transcript_4432:657-1313(-)